MKNGANQTDQRKIRRLTERGFSPEDISRNLKIEVKCVKSFIDHFKHPEKKAKRDKARAKKVAQEKQQQAISAAAALIAGGATPADAKLDVASTDA